MENQHQTDTHSGKYNNKNFYVDKDGRYVFTAHFLLKRGACCGNGCLHCPYQPKHIKNNQSTGAATIYEK
jgi:hypothetical protein